MLDYKDFRKKLNSCMNTKHYQNGKVSIQDTASFKGIALSDLEELQDMVEKSIREDTYSFARKCGATSVDTLKSITERANRNIGAVLDCIATKPMTKEEMRGYLSNPKGIRDSIFNNRWNIGNNTDPSTANLSTPNIYISPYEANSLYSQKGIFETVINKKSKSILLNGCYIENEKLSQKQIDAIQEKMEVLNFKQILSDSVLTSLVYGGALVFPMLKKDTPITTSLKLSTLLKLGILGKDCIDYFVTLDRWNTFIVPPYNPTQKDFISPEYYTIAFLGSDVHNTRCARVVTSKQAGYWGQTLNQGWGISDFCGYLQSGMNYKVAIQSIPLMIQQMSILARVVNVDGVLATEGANALDALVEEGTVRTREASPDNPITLDVLGDIKSINRNFAQVPELIRLLRQDLASNVPLPEPLLFSSEKGNFSSGDDTQGNLYKQNESIQMLHKEVETQFKQLLKIITIDALGTEDDIIQALPYTQIHFDQPVIANALEKAHIGKAHAETIFNLVSARIPIDIAVTMADKSLSSDLRTNSYVLDKLKEIQTKVDENEKERVSLEFEKEKATIGSIQEQTENTVQQRMIEKKQEKESNTKELSFEKEEGSYNRLEQKQHEKTRGFSKREEKLSLFRNKQL